MIESLLPSNATKVEKSIEFAVAQQISSLLVENIYHQWHPQTCPAHLLGWLAWAVSVDDWNPDWPEQVKRDVIEETVEIHRYKGSHYSVIKALSPIGIKTQVIESRTEPETMVPFSFKVTALANGEVSNNDVIIDQNLYDDIRRRVVNTKPQRSQFELQVGAEYTTSINLTTALQSASYRRNRALAKTYPVVRRLSGLLAMVTQAASVLRLTMMTTGGASK